MNLKLITLIIWDQERTQKLSTDTRINTLQKKSRKKIKMKIKQLLTEPLGNIKKKIPAHISSVQVIYQCTLLC